MIGWSTVFRMLRPVGSNRGPMAWINGFWDGSPGHCLVRDGHRCLYGALAEKASVGRPVFAAHGGWQSGTAEREGEAPSGHAADPRTLLEEGSHGQAPRGEISHGFLGALLWPHAAHVQGRDLQRLTWQLRVCQIVLHQPTQTLVNLLQIHLFVLVITKKQGD